MRCSNLVPHQGHVCPAGDAAKPFVTACPSPSSLGAHRCRAASSSRLPPLARAEVVADPKIGPQLGARQQAQAVAGEAGACGAVWSGGLGLACSVWLGFGDAAQGDFEAEGAELADVVGDLPAGVALAFVVVNAEVLIAMPGLDSSLW